MRYRLRIDGGDELLADPASRFQPEGPHGPSEIVDEHAYAWKHDAWRGVSLEGQVISEVHVGTLTVEGTFRAALDELPRMRDVGITLVELMPVADFPGRFGWGYDGVCLFAPYRVYGTPDELRAFIDAAHGHGMGVLLDVVYNHVGPDGSTLGRFFEHLHHSDAPSEWGPVIDFETEPLVRELFCANAAYWIKDFRFDGLRLDATHQIRDRSPRHILADIGDAARAAAGSRSIVLIAENEPQHTRLVRAQSQDGLGLDAVWNDDFHHSAVVALTGRREAYYAPARGTAQELVSAIKWGYLFQGQWYEWLKKPRGTPAFDVPPSAFVVFTENHDQIANSPSGRRPSAIVAPGAYRAMTTAMLLAPSTPMFFQGQEIGAQSPFFFFADHEPNLAEAVRRGRRELERLFPSARDERNELIVPPPEDPRAFRLSKLLQRDDARERAAREFHKTLLRMRRDDEVFRAQRSDWLYGAVLGDGAFALRFATGTGKDRLVLVNLGHDLDLTEVSEPLLAPLVDRPFEIVFSSEDPRWGGCGTAPMGEHGRLVLAARCALVLAPSQTACIAHDDGGAP
jgi:maltooligosyltrehalose trehalohydrolase